MNWNLRYAGVGMIWNPHTENCLSCREYDSHKKRIMDGTRGAEGKTRPLDHEEQSAIETLDAQYQRHLDTHKGVKK